MTSPQYERSLFDGFAAEYGMEDIEYREAQKSRTIIAPQYFRPISRPRHIVALDDITDSEPACETKSWPRRIFLWACIVTLLVASFSFYVNDRLDLESMWEALKTPLGSVLMTGVLTCSVLFL